ncbi:MAG: phosphoenolpyruvate carboxylase [Pirellulaceae bacterium]
MKEKISADIRLLAGLLGEVIADQEGPAHLELEESIRRCSKAARAGDASAIESLQSIIAKVTDDLEATTTVLKAFTIYFYLINLAEVRQRIRVLRSRGHEAEKTETPIRESIADAVASLHAAGAKPAEIQALLNQMFVSPVFTAHPTESQRKTVLMILQKIDAILKQLDRDELLLSERNAFVAELRRQIVLLWQSDETRSRKPTVMDEVRNNGIYYFENTLFEVIPDIYQQLERELNNVFPDTQWQVPPFLRYGSWIGGDRDGNPFVTCDITEEALRTHKEEILKQYNIEVDRLYSELSSSNHRVGISQQLLESIERDREVCTDSELELLDRFSSEPYRQKMLVMFWRLRTTRDDNQAAWTNSSKQSRGYASVEAFRDELLLVDRSLRDHQGATIADGSLKKLIRMVDVFGFHLASLDIRQHANRHREAIADVFSRFGAKNYLELSDAEKIQWVEQEIRSRRPLTAQLDYNDTTNESIRLMRLIKRAHDAVGPNSISTYIISMTTSELNVLELLLLCRDAGLLGRIDLVPLFETIDDLVNAPEVMRRLYQNEVYQEHLRLRGNRQQIMIGYSDSNKDGGFLRANWMLYRAQRTLSAVANELNIEQVLFHGRGGSLGRGGGPANRAILAQPPESVQGRIKITEQGEVISARYGNRRIARRHLEQLTHAVLCSGMPSRQEPAAATGEWVDVMEAISQSSYNAYRSLVERPEFLSFFESATPIRFIDRLNLGSRPARRKKTAAISDLRAIPWVFAWTQSRLYIPSWYGVGTGFDEWIGKDDKRLNQLKAMYRDWAFFRTAIDNVHLGLGRSDLSVGEVYSKLASESVRQAIWPLLTDEYRRTEKRILEISGQSEVLGTEPWLRDSIRKRNPYVDPLNLLQAELSRQSASLAENDPRWEQLELALLLSVNGIAAGLRNVG